MTIVKKSIEIKAPPEKIWPLMQWERSPEWYTAFKKVEYTSKDKKNKVGATVHVVGEVGGVKAEWDAETTEMIENGKVAWRSTGGNFTGFGSNVLTPTKTGTEVTLMIEYELPYSILGKIIDKLRFHKAFEKSFDDALNKLKDVMEK